MSIGIPQQRRALNKLHGEIRLRPESGIGGAGFIDLRDAGMVEAAERLGFVLEAPEQLAAGEAGPDHFKSYRAARLVLLGLVHGAHAAFTQQADDPVAPQTVPAGRAPPTSRVPDSRGRAVFRFQELSYLLPQGSVGADVVQKGLPLAPWGFSWAARKTSFI